MFDIIWMIRALYCIPSDAKYLAGKLRLMRILPSKDRIGSLFRCGDIWI